MKLSKAVTIFHRTVVQDAYDLETYFRGRVHPYDDNARDSLMTDRRILAIGSDAEIPEHRTVMIEGQAFLLGDESKDLHGDEILHRKVVMHRVDHVAQVRTFEEALSGTGSRDIWAGRVWVKETKEPEESASSYGQYQIYFSKGEDLTDPRVGTFDGDEKIVLVKLENRWHIVRDNFSSAGGFQVCVVDELPEPVLGTVSYKANVYDPVTDTDTTDTDAIAGIMLRWQPSFKYLHAYSPQFQTGDYVLVILKSDVATPNADDIVTVSSRDFRVITAIDQGATWACHVRLL